MVEEEQTVGKGQAAEAEDGLVVLAFERLVLERFVQMLNEAKISPPGPAGRGFYCVFEIEEVEPGFGQLNAYVHARRFDGGTPLSLAR